MSKVGSTTTSQTAAPPPQVSETDKANTTKTQETSDTSKTTESSQNAQASKDLANQKMGDQKFEGTVRQAELEKDLNTPKVEDNHWKPAPGQKGRPEHWNVRQDIKGYKPLLKEMRETLTKDIQEKGGKREHDFRFLLPMAQWTTEQGGYTNRPEGYNPGNVMGPGDAGTFHRKNNTEVVNGKRTNVPADFAKYSSLEKGTDAYMNHLEKRWGKTHDAILHGGSTKDFADGLYPGKGKNYATASQADYKSAMNVRVKNIIEDYKLVIKDDMKDVDKDIAKLKGHLSDPKVDSSLHPEIQNRINRLEKNKENLQAELNELEEVRKRHERGEALQP
jgi:flagellum-specific peptidoglycan hydrolase FlgJ